MTRLGAVERTFQFSLLGMLLAGYLAVAGSAALDLASAAVAGSALAYRGVSLARRSSWSIPDRWVTIATFAYILFYPVDFLYLSRDFVKATVHLVLFLAMVKVLTASNERDYFYLKVIAFLQMLAGAVLSASWLFFLSLALFLFFGIATLATSEIRRSAAKPRQISTAMLTGFSPRLLKLTGGIGSSVLLLTILLFFILPRTTRAALQAWIDPRYHLSGFSNQVVLGQIGEIRLQHEPVMHVRVFSDDRSIPLKWRGAALSKFDGRAWSNTVRRARRLVPERSVIRLADTEQQRRAGKRFIYEVQLRPTGSDTMFLSGLPEFLQTDAPAIYRTPAASFFSAHLRGRVVRYSAHARLEGRLAPGEAPLDDRDEYLQLPTLDSRIAALASEWAAAGGEDPELRALALEKRLRSAYRYSTELLDREVPDPLAHFLFDRGKGHCEYFASALAVMLRTTGLPSRVITGFQAGTFNPVSGLYVVRASDAHSWVEAFIEGKGWITLDPTPPDLAPAGFTSLLSRLGNYADAVETFWQDWVLSYNLDQQAALVTRVDLSRPTQAAASLLRRVVGLPGRISLLDWRLGGVGILLVALAFAGWLYIPFWARRWSIRSHEERLAAGKARPKDATLLYLRLVDLLRERGIEKGASTTPAEFAERLADRPEGPAVREITEAYYSFRFGGDPAQAARMLALLRQLRA